ncbi:hypothetical protein [Tropicimonas isoalkanivorans]|uniref:Uncharacterized protein n=1 Tax=Tropicimonas isoalkanivorans TaxID=441112 RepID=A0A1I1PK14_9RHOB|nr:hypothetical protein [Tropicimonas isoalkanivorans]SFD10161.1 hypothetical protein SAMN04488094_11571 [Tropicimonas isoalkanivorans]
MAANGTTHKPQSEIDESHAEKEETTHRAQTEDARSEMIPPIEPADTMLVKGPPEGDLSAAPNEHGNGSTLRHGDGAPETGTIPSKFAIGAGVVVCILLLLVLGAIF